MLGQQDDIKRCRQTSKSREISFSVLTFFCAGVVVIFTRLLTIKEVGGRCKYTLVQPSPVALFQQKIKWEALTFNSFHFHFTQTSMNKMEHNRSAVYLNRLKSFLILYNITYAIHFEYIPNTKWEYKLLDYFSFSALKTSKQSSISNSY